MGRRAVTFEGILPAMVTPTDETGAIDEGALTKLTDRLIRAGSGGLIPVEAQGNSRRYP